MTSNAHRQRGMSLIEILIAVLILAVGVLGIAALQSVTLKNNESASARTMAVIQSYSMLDMLRANRAAAVGGVYNQGFLCQAPEEPDADTPQAGRVHDDVTRWITQLQGTIGAGACGSINCGANVCTISVRLDEARTTGGSEMSDNGRMTIVTRTRL